MDRFNNAQDHIEYMDDLSEEYDVDVIAHSGKEIPKQEDKEPISFRDRFINKLENLIFLLCPC